MRLLNRLKKRLRELGAERVRIGRKWYWSLKGDYRFWEEIRDMNNFELAMGFLEE